MDILITGASSGIGAAAADALACGNRIFLVYHTGGKNIQIVSQSIEAKGGQAVSIFADIATPEGCQFVFDQVVSRTDQLDVLVNAAGAIVRRAQIGSLTWQDMQDIFSTNTFSAMYLTSLFTEMLRKSGQACVINFSSAATYSGSAGAPLYASAKGAIEVFTRCLTQALAPAVRAVTIAPGVVETPFHAGVTAPEVLQKWAETNPLGRNGTPQEIAQAVKFCVENTFLNGAMLDVNGGKRGV